MQYIPYLIKILGKCPSPKILWCEEPVTNMKILNPQSISPISQEN